MSDEEFIKALRSYIPVEGQEGLAARDRQRNIAANRIEVLSHNLKGSQAFHHARVPPDTLPLTEEVINDVQNHWRCLGQRISVAVLDALCAAARNGIK